MYEYQGNRPKVTAATWLPFDSSLVAIAYDNGHVALFDVVTGMLTQALEVSSSAALSLTAHDLEPQIVSGHEDGNIIVTDIKSGAPVTRISGGQASTVLSLVNKGLGLIAGKVDGSVVVYDFKTGETKMSTDMHAAREGVGINCMVMFETDKPFIVTGGADGQFKVLEHNPYVLDENISGDSVLMLKLSDELDMGQLKSLPTDEVKSLFKEQI